jgi:predicted ATPase/DNA-binding SARP family transcriptional activator
VAGNLRLNLLGETEIVRIEPQPAPLGGPRPRAILAYVALQAPRAVSRAELIDAIWGADPPRAAANALQTHVSMLRKVLGAGVFDTVGDGYRLGAEVVVDVAEFERSVRAGSTMLVRGDAIGAAETLRSALSLWRGRALADVGDAAFAAQETARLEETRLAAIERRVEADLDAGRNDELVVELEALVAAHPLREKLCGQLMRALYRSGRQAEALAVFETTRLRLVAELGLDPSPALREVHVRLLRQADVPSGPTRDRVWSRIPALPDETIGRESDLAALESLVTSGDHRLVCVLGPGGVGKTRLVTELGHRLLGRYRDGVSFVGLADAQTSADVAPILCAALGIAAATDAPSAALLAALRGQQTLLICDNFEHVVGAATVLSDLLAGAPGLRLVVTSRRRLEIRGERTFVVEPLRYTVDGDGVAPAVALFQARARAVTPDLPEAQLDDVAEICARCDGLPLAIELAAARTRALTVAELRSHLDRPLAVLTEGPRDAPARHQTLRANIASSVDALSGEDRLFLRSLTVFQGGFSLASAAAVNQIESTVALRRIETLLGHSVVRGRAGAAGQRRFDLLETVREFLSETLDDDELANLRRQHAEHFRRWLGPTQDPSWNPHRTKDWQAQMAERPNLRAAIRWAAEAGDPEQFADLVISVGTMWVRLGPRNEIEQWLRRIADDEKLPVGRRADAYTQLAMLSETTSGLAEAQSLMATAEGLIAGSGDHRRIAWVSAYGSWYQRLSGGAEKADRLLEQTRMSTVASGNPPDLVTAIEDVVMMAAAVDGDFATAHAHAQTMLRLARQHDLDVHVLNALNALCETGLMLGRPEEVIGWSEEGMRLAGDLTDMYAWHRSQHGLARLEVGDAAGAEADLTAALDLYTREGLGIEGMEVVLRLAAVAARTGRPALAATLVAAFDEAGSGTAVAASPGVHRVRATYVDDLTERLGDEFAEHGDRGRDLVRGMDYRDAFRAILGLVRDSTP